MNIRKICVIHLNQIGDLVFSLPLLKALKDNFPQARLHSVVKPHLAALLDGSPWVDEIILRKAGFNSRLKLVRTLRKNRYDLLVALPRSEEALAIASLSRARLKAGFSRKGWDFALDIKTGIKGHHGWVNNRTLLQKIGIPIVKDDYVNLLSSQDWSYDGTLPDNYAVFAPCASNRRLTKTWEQDKFAEVMVGLYRDRGLHPVLVGGGDDADSNRGIEEMVLERGQGKVEVLNLTGEVSLKELCVVLRNARLVVGIDSGVIHLASSLDKPLVVLFGPTDPRYVGPHNKDSVIIQHSEIPCVPCYLQNCSLTECMTAITAEEVLQASDSLLKGSNNVVSRS